MIVSFPLTSLARDVARDIAASGVSEVDFEAVAMPTGRTGWRALAPTANPYLVPPPACPECGTLVVRASACISCPGCGWGKCG